MAYRNGTYVTFHANDTSDPTKSDMKYYALLQAWNQNKNIDFQFENSHDKTNAVRDSSKRKTLEDTLMKRLNNSKNMILVLSSSTKYDTDWVPFEIKHGVDNCKLPIFVVYPDYDYILEPEGLSYLWPQDLKQRLENNSVFTIHLPFKKEPILEVIENFSITNYPPWNVCHFTKKQYESWGEIILPNISNFPKLF